MEPMEKCRMERGPIQMGRYDGAGGSLFRIENTFQEVGSQCLFFKRIVSMDGVKICGEKIVER